MRETKEVTKYDNESILKSRGERDIARFLNTQGIDYDYEYPLAIIDHGKTRIWYPDFRLRAFNIIVEYFGMNGNSSYNDMIAHKLKVYQEAGYDGIFLLDSTMQGAWQSMLLERVEQVIEGKLRKIRNYRESFNESITED